MQANEVSLRNLIPPELARGFGFLQSKPATNFSPVAVTPDELGDAWKGSNVHLPLRSTWNGKLVGQPMAAPTWCSTSRRWWPTCAKRAMRARRPLSGSGTVSNKDDRRGYSCIAEKRCLEMIADGSASTPFMLPATLSASRCSTRPASPFIAPLTRRWCRERRPNAM